MVTESQFLRALRSKLARHRGEPLAVLGHRAVCSAIALATAPLYLRAVTRVGARVRTLGRPRIGRTPIRGVSLYTGNVSLRRQLYHDVGGFDPSLRRSEDREFGIRLEKAGASFGFSSDAESRNHSDHVRLEAWLGRALQYGIADYRIARKHEDLEIADPWRFLFLVSPLSRPLLAGVVLLPSIAQPVSRLVMAIALPLDHIRLERLALAGTTLAYGVQYYRGVRTQAGSLGAAAQTFARYLRKRARERMRAP